MASSPSIQVLDIPLKSIVIGNNDRTTYRDIPDLAASIDENGLRQPVNVRPLLAGQYELMAGHRRYYAFEHLGRETIPAVVEDADDDKAARIMWEENNQRVDLDPMDEARAINKRRTAHNPPLTAECLGRQLGKSPGFIRDRLTLLSLVPQAQHLVAAGQLKIGYALELAKLDVNRQHIAMKSLHGEISLANFRKLCGKLLVEQAQESMFDLGLFMQGVIEEKREQEEKVQARRFPVDDRLPEPEFTGKGIGLAFESYIHQLTLAGEKDAAAVIGRMYEGMLKNGLAFRPAKSPLDGGK